MRRLLAGAVVTLALAFGLWLAVGVSASTSTTGQVPAVPAPAVQMRAVDHQAGATAGPATATVGSQSTTETANESASGTENESAGDSAKEGDRHEDPSGQDVNHQCPPDCDVANGERP